MVAAVQRTPEQETASAKFRSDFSTALNITTYEKIATLASSEADAARYIVSRRDPDVILDAFAKSAPQWGGVIDAIKKDDELKKAMHSALAKDPTMLTGMQGFVTGEGQKADPKELESFLQTPRNRKAFSAVLTKVADEERYTFKDFQELYNSKDDEKKSIEKLTQMGIKPTDLMTSQDMFGMVKDFFRNPIGFADKMPGMLGLSGEQGKAFSEIFKVFGQYIELCIGGNDGYRALAEKYGPGLMDKGASMLDRLSGDADKRIAEQRSLAGTGKPTTDKTPDDLKSKGGATAAQAQSVETPATPVPTSARPAPDTRPAPGFGPQQPQ